MRFLSIILALSVVGLLSFAVSQRNAIVQLQRELRAQTDDSADVLPDQEFPAHETQKMDVAEIEKRFNTLDETVGLDAVFSVLAVSDNLQRLHDSMRESQGMMAISRVYRLADNCQFTTLVYEDGRTVCKLVSPTFPEGAEIEIAKLPKTHPRMLWWHGIQ